MKNSKIINILNQYKNENNVNTHNLINRINKNTELFINNMNNTFTDIKNINECIININKDFIIAKENNDKSIEKLNYNINNNESKLFVKILTLEKLND
jgi:hypothetical protein